MYYSNKILLLNSTLKCHPQPLNLCLKVFHLCLMISLNWWVYNLLLNIHHLCWYIIDGNLRFFNFRDFLINISELHSLFSTLTLASAFIWLISPSLVQCDSSSLLLILLDVNLHSDRNLCLFEGHLHLLGTLCKVNLRCFN